MVWVRRPDPRLTTNWSRLLWREVRLSRLSRLRLPLHIKRIIWLSRGRLSRLLIRQMFNRLLINKISLRANRKRVCVGLSRLVNRLNSLNRLRLLLRRRIRRFWIQIRRRTHIIPI
jgi:hypothetical protein